MASAIGSETIVGCGEELPGAYGTPVAITRFTEFLSESLVRRPKYIEPKGLRGGLARNLPPGSREVLIPGDAGGALSMEVATAGMGRWYKHLLGGTPVVTGTGPAYTHTFSLGANTGKSLTVEKQLRDDAQTVIESFVYPGTKIMSGTFTNDVEEVLRLELELDCRTERDDIAPSSAVYTNPGLFHYGQGSILVGGVAVACVQVPTITFNNNLKTESPCFGGFGLKKEPAPDTKPTVEGSLSAEFESTALYQRFRDYSPASLVLEWVSTGINIPGTTTPYKLTITVPEVRFRGGTPTVGGPEVIVADYAFVGRANDAGTAGITITAVTSDNAV